MAEENSAATGTILHLQRLSTEDGPGIRTTVFFKGCPLKCQWCHNPESLSLQQQVQWIGNRCIGCESCIKACEEHGLTHTQKGIVRDRALCIVCGRCVEACPAGAMELLGKEVSAADLTVELVKDRAYFEKSGGGVTLSGGEPTLQPEFCAALMDHMHAEGVHVALDTCGMCNPAVFKKLVEKSDLILFDLKLISPDAHKRWTGADNTRILANLEVVREIVAASDGAKRLWIRTPLIPGATTARENLMGISAHLAGTPDGTVERWELCAFNNLCRDKYERLGMQWAFAETRLLSAEELQQLGKWAGAGGFDPARIFVTGAAKAG
ncbi:MAG TPA: glycyl-radical enzyme activating protein [Anaerolineaceae bacterium]|nr:glycyl-radical enzyme activating protein [Anaerolineaceae bacterium]